jgi:hypothetical protein
MLSYATFITESFDRPLSWRWTNQSPTNYSATFQKCGIEAKVNINPLSDDPNETENSMWSIEFATASILDTRMYSKWRQDTTNTGYEIPIFSTVGDIAVNFIRKQKPLELHFTADDPKRENLYARIAKRLASSTGYKIKQASSGIYILSKH